MDLSFIFQRINKLKQQLGIGQEYISPVADESPDEKWSRVSEEWRSMQGGEPPTQDVFNLMKSRRDAGTADKQTLAYMNRYDRGIKELESKGPTPRVASVSKPNVLGQSVSPTATPTPTPSPMPFKKSNEMGWIRPQHQQFLESTVFPVTDQAGLPRDLSAGQWAGETRSTGNEMNNVFGLGPNIRYKDLPSNVKAYVQTVKKLLKQRGIDDPSGMSGADILNIIQDDRGQRYEGHKPNPKYYVDYIKSIPEFRYYQGVKN